MSTQASHQFDWTPSAIATVVYQVVMIIVSIVSIWKKYRRPIRQFDEEQLMGILLPAHHIQESQLQSTIPRPQSANPTRLGVASAHNLRTPSTSQRDYRSASWERRAYYECNRRRTFSSHRSS